MTADLDDFFFKTSKDVDTMQNTEGTNETSNYDTESEEEEFLI